jgi:hypothetical protein
MERLSRSSPLDLSPTFVEPPRVEWHRGRPFAFSRLPEDYARRLEALAHNLAPRLEALDAAPEMLNWAGPYGARFNRYNIFLLDAAYLPLFWAMRATYRTLIEAMRLERRSCCARGWLNIQQAGERIGPHLHEAKFVGTFAARAQGSDTRFTLLEDKMEDGVIIPNVDGQLLLTFGAHHRHDTTEWQRTDVARVTYAIDILAADKWSANNIQVPFDAPPVPLSDGSAAPANS